MLKLKIAVLSINNLTDARYFAAYGVDYLGFDLNTESDDFLGFDKIKEIVEWVEGPKTLGQLTDVSGKNLFDEVLTLDAVCDQKVIVDGEAEYPIIDFVQGGFSKGMFIDGFDGVEDIQFIIEQGLDLGLVLRGGDETKVGVKTYDELDAIFELLLP